MGTGAGGGGPLPMSAPMKMIRRRGRPGASSNVEAAVLGHGKVEGPYTELAGLTVERDPKFPIRITVQFYQATSNGVLSQADVNRLHAKIKKVYGSADYVGSLVVPAPGDRRHTGVHRPTDWTGASRPPANLSWWDFPGLVQWVLDNTVGIARPRPRPYHPVGIK